MLMFKIALLAVLPTLGLTAPIGGKDYRSMSDIEIMELCDEDKMAWRLDSNHMCQYLEDKNKSLSDLSPDLNSRILELRPLYLEYLSEKGIAAQMLEMCYYELWNFNRCLYKVQNALDFTGFTERSLHRLKSMWQGYLEADISFVQHCFWSHQNDRYFGCQGISWGHDDSVWMKRDDHLTGAWDREKNRLAEQIAKAKERNDTVTAEVYRCLYSNDWMKPTQSVSKTTDLCYYVSGKRPYSLHSSGEEKQRMDLLISAYEEQQLIDKVTDCFHHHKYDANSYDACEGISWSPHDFSFPGHYKPEDPKIRAIWDKVEKDAENVRFWRKLFIERN